jgi:hypothetical protein
MRDRNIDFFMVCLMTVIGIFLQIAETSYWLGFFVGATSVLLDDYLHKKYKWWRK